MEVGNDKLCPFGDGEKPGRCQLLVSGSVIHTKKEGGLTNLKIGTRVMKKFTLRIAEYMDPIRIEFKISIPNFLPKRTCFCFHPLDQEKKKAREALREDFARLCRERASANRSKAAKPELQIVDPQFDEEEEDDV